MTKLPVISGKQLIKVLIKVGFCVYHKKGSHVTLKRDSPPCRVTVPDHETLKMGLLLGIMRQTQITRKELLGLLK